MKEGGLRLAEILFLSSGMVSRGEAAGILNRRIAVAIL